MSRAKDGERPLIDQAVAPRSDLGWRAGLGDHAAGRTVQQPSGLGRHCSASGGRWALRSAQSTRGLASYELRGGFISAVGRVSLGIMDRTGDHPSLNSHIQLVRQTAWHAPGQLVPDEVQLCQLGEVAQLRRYLPAQLVVIGHNGGAGGSSVLRID